MVRQGRGVWAAPAIVLPLAWYHLCLGLTHGTIVVFLNARLLLKVHKSTLLEFGVLLTAMHNRLQTTTCI